MKRRETGKPGYERLLEAWDPPDDAGDPIGCVATSYTFSSEFFEEQCLGRFVGMQTEAAEDGAAFLIEREEKFSQLACAAVVVDQRHARCRRINLRWDLLSARLRGNGILHGKVSLLLWTKAARVIVASANLTRFGYRQNHEVFGVLDYGKGSAAPANVAKELSGFIADALGLVDPAAAAPQVNPAVRRCRRFLKRFERATARFSAGERRLRNAPQVHAIVIGPGRETLFGRVQTLWRETARSKPHSAWVISPFFDPPESPNAPAKKIWECLSPRSGELCYSLAGDGESDGLSSARLLGPESLQWSPPGRNQSLSFERLKLEPTRPLHAKCLWFEGHESFLYVCGSTNFTSAGTGIGKTKNLEANLAYLVNFARNKAADKACIAAWLEGEPVENPILIPPPESAEDDPKTGDLPLPEAFGSATFTRNAAGASCVQFTFHGTTPADWQVRPDDGTDRVFIDEATWKGKGAPESYEVTWESDSPPFGFRVRWAGSERDAWWPVNVGDGSVLAPPQGLADKSLEELILILTSAKPLYLALARLFRNPPAAGSGNSPAIDPHDRVDISTFLMQRTHRVARALAALRSRLEKPIATWESLEWRLRGPVSVEALTHAISKEARSPEERAFLLVEVMLELARVRPVACSGGLKITAVRSELRKMIQRLAKQVDCESLRHVPAMRKYVQAAQAAAL